MDIRDFEKIALWMGWKKIKPFGITEVWQSPLGMITDNVADKTSLTPAECYEALDRLVEKGVMYELWSGFDVDGQTPIHGCSLCALERWQSADFGSIADDPKAITGKAPTIHGSVEQALFQIAAKEG